MHKREGGRERRAPRLGQGQVPPGPTPPRPAPRERPLAPQAGLPGPAGSPRPAEQRELGLAGRG